MLLKTDILLIRQLRQTSLWIFVSKTESSRKLPKILHLKLVKKSLICPALQLLRDSSTLMFISEIPDLLIKKIFIPVLLPLQRGGFTSVICMANTKPTVDSVDTLSDILNRAKVENIHIYQTASVSYGLNGEKMTDFDALADAGACGFTDDGIPLLNATFCYEAMQKAAALHMPISLHEEDKAFITNNGINAGETSAQLGVIGSPAIAEEVMVARDCMLALRSGATVVIQHISSGNSVELVRTAKNSVLTSTLKQPLITLH